MVGISSSSFTSCPTLTVSRRQSAAAEGQRLSSLHLLRLGGRSNRHNIVRCRSGGGNHSPPSGDNDSKVVLEAFFLGKAFAEALNERVGSAVGEALSVFGQWQAEQQKQVRDFQEEVVERAKRGKEKAALEAMEASGIISKSLIQPPLKAPPSNGGPNIENPLIEILKD